MERRFDALVVLVCLTLSACSTFRVSPRGDPNAVAIEGALANRFVPAATQSAVVARVRIAVRPPFNRRRPPVNLALVVDTSGSMEGQPIDDARAAALSAIDALSNGDVVSVTVFHSRGEVILPATTLRDGNRTSVRARVQAMRAQGTTDMAGGLSLGYQQVLQRFRSDGVNRIVLLSDGVPNDPANLESIARIAHEHGVAITSLGLGLDYNETLMAALADRSGGRFHYIENSTQVAAVFRDEVLRLRRVIGRNATVTLTPGPGVRIERVVGLASSNEGDAVRIALGDVTESEGRDLIVRLAVGARRRGASVELMDAVLSFDDALAGAGRIERRLFLGAHASSDDNELTSGRNAEVERDAARIEAAAATIDAIRLARRGDVATATQSLERAEIAARAIGSANNDASLLVQAQAMNELRNALPEAVAPTRMGSNDGAGSAPAAVLRREHNRAVQSSQGY